MLKQLTVYVWCRFNVLMSQVNACWIVKHNFGIHTLSYDLRCYSWNFYKHWFFLKYFTVVYAAAHKQRDQLKEKQPKRRGTEFSGDSIGFTLVIKDGNISIQRYFFLSFFWKSSNTKYIIVITKNDIRKCTRKT